MRKRRRFACVVAEHDLRVSLPVEGTNQPKNIFNRLLTDPDWDIFTLQASLDGPTVGWNAALRLADQLFRRTPQYDALLIGADDIGLPIAAYGEKHFPETPVNILTMGALFWWQNRLSLLQRLRNTKFLCISEALRTHLLAELSLPPDYVANVGYAIDTEFFRPVPSADLPRRLMIASAGLQDRDYDTLKSASVGLDVDVTIAAGSCWRPASLNMPVRRAASNVIVTSYKNRAELREVYANAAFVVVPLYPVPSASGITVVGEAMSMGKAVIVTHTDGRSDLLREGETGFFVAARDPGDLRCRMLTLLNNPSLAIRMGATARRLMESRFSIATVYTRIKRSLRHSHVM